MLFRSTLGDVALLLDAMVGTHRRDPIALPAPLVPFQAAVKGPTAPRRVAFSRDLGVTSMDREIGDICAAAAARFSEMAAVVEDAAPDLHDARDIFRVLRSARTVADPGGLIDRKSTRLNSSHVVNSYAVFCLKK